MDIVRDGDGSDVDVLELEGGGGTIGARLDVSVIIQRSRTVSV